MFTVQVEMRNGIRRLIICSGHPPFHQKSEWPSLTNYKRSDPYFVMEEKLAHDQGTRTDLMGRTRLGLWYGNIRTRKNSLEDIAEIPSTQVTSSYLIVTNIFPLSQAGFAKDSSSLFGSWPHRSVKHNRPSNWNLTGNFTQ